MANSILPNEIWCHIFLYLDEKSLRTIIASICKIFFELVRGNEKLSGCIILKSVMLKDLAIKIKNSEWIWERWPSLQTLKIPIVNTEYSDDYIYHKSNVFTSVYEKEARKLIQEMKFETCSNLEKVVLFNCCWSIQENSDLMKVFDGLRHGHVMEYSFHPKDIPFIQRWENITAIHLSDFDTNFSSTFGKIEEIAKSLNTLSISVNHFDRLQQRKLQNGDSVMFDGLNRTLKSVDLEFESAQSIHKQSLSTTSNIDPQLLCQKLVKKY